MNVSDWFAIGFVSLACALVAAAHDVPMVPMLPVPLTVVSMGAFGWALVDLLRADS